MSSTPKDRKSERKKCPECGAILKRVMVKVQGALTRAVSYQCLNCDYFEFEPISSQKVIEELKETPLKIRQRVVKLSQDRLGMYFNTHVVQSLGLRKGEEILISVPDKKHIMIELQ